MLETNIKRIIKLIDLLVKEGFSGLIDVGQALETVLSTLIRNILMMLSSHVVE